MKKNIAKSSPDYVFIGLVVILTVFGLVMLSSASSDLSKTKFGDSYYYLKHQIVYGLGFGIVGFFAAAFLSYRHWEKWSTLLLVINIVLLLLVFSPIGLKIKGGERWIDFGFFSFQPGELLKLSFFAYLAAWISKNQKRGKSFMEGFLPFLILTGGVMMLLLAQPAITTAILIFAASLIMYFASGARFSFIVASVLLAVLAVSTVIYYNPNRIQRIEAFLNPNADQLNSSYHINQSLIAIGSGGLTGVGFGQSTTKLKYLPEPIGDSIFAIIAEELGFIGAMSLIAVFMLFVWRGLAIARASRDIFARLFVTGMTSTVGLQAFVNIAAISGLIPISGVPLPFISYGGTALAVFLTMSGIIVNVSRRRN
jgi:cell division protein FtsW